MRKPIIAANFKMQKTVSETVAYLSEFVKLTADVEHAEVIIVPQAVTLAVAVPLVKGSKVALGVQNVHWETSGAFTGENSADTVKDMGVSHTVLGHSERRTIFGDTNETVNLRTKCALKSGLKVIFCIGETLEQREAGETISWVKSQIVNGLKDLTSADLDNIAIAYEPIWAIGTGVTASPAQAQDVHAAIRKEIVSLYDAETADKMRILYGGSVKPANVKELMSQTDIDGALVGGASLTTESFIQVVNFQ